MPNNSPLIIVMTPVRNEAWVLRAFLEATSLWADYIVIADQMSTDGSREIAREYPKVILIDNDRKEMHMAATRRLMFDAVRKIEGEKILFALDADEFLSGDFVNTDDWKKIMDSSPDDSFCWRWMNLKSGDATQYSTSQHYYWAVHESEDLWNGKFPDRCTHEWRLPWSPRADAPHNHKFFLNDFFSIHLSRLNEQRQCNKERFYQVSTVGNNVKNSMVSIFRQYHVEDASNYMSVPDNAYRYYENHGLDIWKYIDVSNEGRHYTREVLKCFDRDGLKRYALLDIWDKDWMVENGIQDPRNGIQKLFHYYMHKTKPYVERNWVRAIDKVLRVFV